MRSIRLLAMATTVLVLGSACGGDDGDGGTGPDTQAPVADFAVPTNCVAGTLCNFTSSSTDNVGVTTYSWDFDGAGTGTNQTTAAASFTFSPEGTYPVTLTVGDAAGNSHSVTKSVVVAAAPVGNTPPTASFTAPTGCTVDSACPFTSDASTDADGTITAWEWNFGDGTAVDNNASTNHTFSVEGVYQVQLTVTDDDAATNSITLPVTISAPSATQCTTISTIEVDCALSIVAQSTITLTLTDVECELGGNLIHIPPPGVDVAQNVFGNVCDIPDQAPKTLTTEAGAPLVFEAGSTLHVRLRRGTGTPEPGSPAGNITGTGPTWTLNFDDGGNPGVEGEPDFGDVVVTVQANTP